MEEPRADPGKDLTIWLDIGAHECQEINSAFGASTTAAYALLRRAISWTIFRRGDYFPLHHAKETWRFRKMLRKRRHLFRVVAVEANSQLVLQKSRKYSNVDQLFNVAISDVTELSFSIAQLFITESALGVGNSIYATKPDIQHNNFLISAFVNVDTFVDALRLWLESTTEKYRVILRVNCEGVEDQAIYSCHRAFGPHLSAVMGSLKDVSAVKGHEASARLYRYMDDSGIPFQRFTPNASTWHQAFRVLLGE